MRSPRLPIPTWMAGWPRGIRPARVVVDERHLALRFVHPERGFRDLELRLEGQGIQAGWTRGTLEDANGLARLRRAVLARLESSPGRDALIAAMRKIRDRVPNDLESPEDASASIASALRLVADGNTLGALTRHWDAIHDAPKRAAFANQTARTLLLTLTGLPLESREIARDAATRAQDADEFAELGRLLTTLGMSDTATVCFRMALAMAPNTGLASQLLLCASVEEDAKLARETANVLRTLGPDERDLELALDALFSAGAFDAYWSLLEEAIAREATSDRLGRAAEYKLFTNQVDQARELASRALARGPNATAELVLGACDCFEGHLQAGLERLEALTAPEAKLWRVRFLFERGDWRAALDLLHGEGELGGANTAWRLWLALVETHRFRRLLPGPAKQLLPILTLIYPDRDQRYHGLHGRNDFQVRQVLIEMFGEAQVSATYAAGHLATFNLLEQSIRLLGGNYSGQSTATEAGTLRKLRVATPRKRTEEAQKLLLRQSLEEVLSGFSPDQASTNPFLATYHAEILLWVGRYTEAVEAFSKVWLATRTRWGYVGLGAALARLERYDEALEAWSEGLKYCRPIPHEATYAYRGEVYLAQGRVTAALTELRGATHASPSRLGAQLALVQAEHRMKNFELARRALDQAARLAPGLLGCVLREQSREDLPTEADDVFETAREALDRMRGNRSSSLYTFFDSAGQMRVIQRHPPEHWTAAARGLRGCAEDLLLAKLEQALELPNVETAVRETNPD